VYFSRHLNRAIHSPDEVDPPRSSDDMFRFFPELLLKPGRYVVPSFPAIDLQTSRARCKYDPIVACRHFSSTETSKEI
jgi:hypothetical protein